MLLFCYYYITYFGYLLTHERLEAKITNKEIRTDSQNWTYFGFIYRIFEVRIQKTFFVWSTRITWLVGASARNRRKKVIRILTFYSWNRNSDFLFWLLFWILLKVSQSEHNFLILCISNIGDLQLGRHRDTYSHLFTVLYSININKSFTNIEIKLAYQMIEFDWLTKGSLAPHLLPQSLSTLIRQVFGQLFTVSE